MGYRKKSRQQLMRSLLPVLVLAVSGALSGIGWLVYGVLHPPTQAYLVTPARLAPLSEQSARATDEVWRNKDGSPARGWLVRGTEGAPAILLLHAYGSDRSALLALGVKLNETLNCTVLWTDARAHGEQPLGGASSFGAREGSDALAAIDFLRRLKTSTDAPLVGGDIGIYGVEMGGYAALIAAREDAAVRALILDSTLAPAEVLSNAARQRAGALAPATAGIIGLGARMFLLNAFSNQEPCAVAKQMPDAPRVLLLSGKDAAHARTETARLAGCFPHQATVELNTELPVTGLRASLATSREADLYDRRVIDFFDRALRPHHQETAAKIIGSE